MKANAALIQKFDEKARIQTKIQRSTNVDFKDFVANNENKIQSAPTPNATNTNMAMRDYTLSTSTYCASSVCKRNATPVNLGFAHLGYEEIKIQKKVL